MTQKYKSFSTLVNNINLSPEPRRVSLHNRIVAAYQLGLRSLILKELKPENKDEFERVFQEDGDLGLLSFGQKYISNFDSKYHHLFEEILDSLNQTIKSSSNNYE